MKKDSLGLMITITLVAIIFCLIVWILAAIGAVDVTKGCLYRYSIDKDGKQSSSDSVTAKAVLKADGNYSAATSVNSTNSGSITSSGDPKDFGQWLNTKFDVKSGDVVDLKIVGEVSLCKSYLPKYNLQTQTNLNSGGKRLAFPKIQSSTGAISNNEPFALIMDAKTIEWRNLAEIYPNDIFQVFIGRDRNKKFDEMVNSVDEVASPTNPSEKSSSSTGNSAASTQNDFINNSVILADCSDGKREYKPICGRYSFFSGKYVSNCSWNPECNKRCISEKECITYDAFGNCTAYGDRDTCTWEGCYENVYGTGPKEYASPEGKKSEGPFTSPYLQDVSKYNMNFSPNCRTSADYINGAYQFDQYFWLSANSASGLLYRADSSEIPSNKSSLGSGYIQAKIIDSTNILPPGSPYKLILNEEVPKTGEIKYLQFRLYSPNEDNSGNTGGYVVGIKHTKCRRVNGEVIDDSLQGRGSVEYVIIAPGQDPSTIPSSEINRVLTDTDGKGSITVPEGRDGTVWMRIKNNPSDYIDSSGQYDVTMYGQIKKGSFLIEVLNPLLLTLKSKIKGASEAIFARMICYKFGEGDQASCNNFFTYIRAMLMLYIATYGLMFLLGAVEISQTDLVIRVIKIVLVAGLLNEKTYEFFNLYIFDFVTNFSDNIVANIGGYGLFNSPGRPVSNPLIFLDELMSQIFFSQTFAAQVMALISMGLSGVFYFIILLIAIVFCVIAVLKALAVYVVAYVAVAVLIGIAPLFLSFILFEATRHLFENWVRFTFRYMIEPVVVLAGLIILTQLFTIYLDMVIGYSVCWKCAVPITIPFPELPGLKIDYVNAPLFCLSWFAPWGHGSNTGPMGISMANISALLILAYCMKTYVDFAGLIVARIAGSMGGPSAARMGGSVSSSISNKMRHPVGRDDNSNASRKSSENRRLNKMHLSNRLGEGKSLEKGRHDVNRSGHSSGHSNSSVNGRGGNSGSGVAGSNNRPDSNKLGNGNSGAGNSGGGNLR